MFSKEQTNAEQVLKTIEFHAELLLKTMSLLSTRYSA